MNPARTRNAETAHDSREFYRVLEQAQLNVLFTLLSENDMMINEHVLRSGSENHTFLNRFDHYVENFRHFCVNEVQVLGSTDITLELFDLSRNNIGTVITNQGLATVDYGRINF